MAYRVLIADKLNQLADDVLVKAGIEVERATGLSEDELCQAVSGFHGMLVRSGVQVTRRVIEAADVLRVVGRAGVGVDNIDVRAAHQRGIVVIKVPQGNSVAAAEHAIAMMMALARKIPQAMESLTSGRWERHLFVGTELCGKTLGLVGFGAVGRIVADRAQGLKMNTMAYDPLVPGFVMRAAGVTPVDSVEALFSSCDVVSLHAVLNEQTSGMVDAKVLSRARPGLLLVNTARGGLVDHEALLRALKDGPLGGAALDVYPKEPPETTGVFEELFGLPNVVVTPHLGASTREAQLNVAVSIAEQVRDYLLHGRVFGQVLP